MLERFQLQKVVVKIEKRRHTLNNFSDPYPHLTGGRCRMK